MTTPSDLNIYQLIDTQNGRVTPRIYTDPDIYQLELERIFGITDGIERSIVVRVEKKASRVLSIRHLSPTRPSILPTRRLPSAIQAPSRQERSTSTSLPTTTSRVWDW